MRRARLAVFLYLFIRLTVPADAMALSAGDYIVSDASLQSIFQVDGTTGDRTVISGCADVLCTASNYVGGGAPMGAPSGLARASNTSVDTPFYVSNPLEVSILRVDPLTGIRTDIFDQFVGGGSGVALESPAGMVLQSNGNLLVVDEGLQALVDVNLTTGVRTIVSGGGVGVGTSFSAPHDLVIDSSGDVLIVDTVLHAIFRVDLASGDRNIISSLALGGGDAMVDPRNITRDSAGNILVSDANADAETPGMVYRVDPDTGIRTFVSAQNVGSGPQIRVAAGLTVDGDDDIVLLDFGPGIVLSITALTGERSVFSSSQTDQMNLSLEGPSWIVGVSVPVPEPNTVILLGIGLAMLSRLDPVKRRKR